jgi:DNA-binding XRE family transcriptional regulator
MNSITISAEEYQDLIDTRDHAIAMRDVASGAPLLTPTAAEAYLKAASPISFWRKQRNLSQARLAAAIGITQPYLAQLESRKRTGDVHLYAKLAKALAVRIEDLLTENEAADV